MIPIGHFRSVFGILILVPLQFFCRCNQSVHACPSNGCDFNVYIMRDRIIEYCLSTVTSWYFKGIAAYVLYPSDRQVRLPLDLGLLCRALSVVWCCCPPGSSFCAFASSSSIMGSFRRSTAYASVKLHTKSTMHHFPFVEGRIRIHVKRPVRSSRPAFIQAGRILSPLADMLRS